jgi:hypothetical protein
MDWGIDGSLLRTGLAGKDMRFKPAASFIRMAASSSTLGKEYKTQAVFLYF